MARSSVAVFARRCGTHPAGLLVLFGLRLGVFSHSAGCRVGRKYDTVKMWFVLSHSLFIFTSVCAQFKMKAFVFLLYLLLVARAVSHPRVLPQRLRRRGGKAQPRRPRTEQLPTPHWHQTDPPLPSGHTQ